MKYRILACLLALAPTMSAAQTTSDPLMSPQRVSDDVRVLASDAFEGRAPATRGETLTIDYVVKQMQAAGLQPGGPPLGGKRSWLQEVALLRSEIIGVPSISVAGAPLTQGVDVAVRAPLNGHRQVDIAAAPMIFAGYGVTAPELNWDDFKGTDVRGKILVVLANDPGLDGSDSNFSSPGATWYSRWIYKYEEAARRGAAGILIVHETYAAGWGWATAKSSYTNEQFDIVRKNPEAEHSQLEGWMQHDLAVRLFAASGLNFDDMKRRARRRDFTPVPLKATLTAHYAADLTETQSHNILGVLPGTSRPNETIIYSAHWDHLGVGAPDAKGDRIYNGAVDNATGVASVLELARAFAGAPGNQRSILFVAFTAEEKGLLGSEFYVTHPVYPLATTVADINMDSVWTGGLTRDFTIAGLTKLDLLDLLIAQGQRRGLTYSPDADPGAGEFYRADHFSFAKRGVPAITINAGRDLVQGGKARGNQIAADYTSKRYHQPGDEWSTNLDFVGMAQVLSQEYDLGHLLANSGGWPNWRPEGEFRQVRDQTADQRK